MAKKGWFRGVFFRQTQKQEPLPAPTAVAALIESAVSLHQQGRLDEASAGYAEILGIQPDNFDALHLSGVVAFQCNRFEDAARLLESAISVNANQATAHTNLGLALQSLERTEDALASFERAIALRPEYPEAHFNRGNALRNIHQPTEALNSYERAIALQPEYTDALNNRGLLLNELQRCEEALVCFDRLISLKPDNAEARNNRGATLCALGRYEDALHEYTVVLAHRPDYAAAHNNRGAVLGTLGMHEEALASYAQALRLEPDYAEAHYNQGAAHSTLKKHAAALASYDNALELKPAYAEALNGRGTTLREMGRLSESLENHDHALALRPDFPEALDNRGIVLASLGRHFEAIESHERALETRPNFASALSNRAAVLREIGELAAAMEAYRTAIAADPGLLAVRFKSLVSCIPVLANDEGEALVSRARFGDETRRLEAWTAFNGFGQEQQAVGAAQPFHLAYQEENNRDLLEGYGRLCSSLMRRWQEQNDLPIVGRSAIASSRLRVGIASAHVHNHSVWNAIVKGWLQQIDQARFEIDVFHLGAKRDAETEFAIDHCARFTHGDMSVRDWASAIGNSELDVLIYPEVGMDITTSRLASMRLAPVQMAAWGHPETTGLPTIDFYISAENFETTVSQTLYTEKLVSLPNLGCYYAPESPATAVVDLAALGIDEESPILICPGTPFKYAPQHDRIFIEIASRLKDAQFIFFNFESVPLLSRRLRQRIVSAFSSVGLEGNSRLRFIPWQSKAGFFALLRRADVFLDTIGFSGFNTAMQSIECGLPIVTREGKFMRGKFASAILRRMQLEELIAGNEAVYVENAVRLATDRQYNATIREKIRESREILFQDPAPIRALEDFLLGLKKGVRA